MPGSIREKGPRWLPADQKRALGTTFLVILTGLASLTGLILAVSPPSSAQVAFENQRDPTACTAVGDDGTNCQDAFSSDNVYVSSSPWYHADWRFRKKLVINATRVAGDLSGFPALIRVSDPDLRDRAQEDGDDVLFTEADGITKLSHEIERFDGTTGELVAWVNVTSLSTTVDPEIYMYYGHPSVGNQEDATRLWDSGYAGVYHLRETPDGTLDDVRDSTQNGNHGTSSGMSAVDQVPGQIGGSLHFGVADRVEIPDGASLEFENAGSISAWFNSDVDLNYLPGGDNPRYRVLVERGGSFLLYYDSAFGSFVIRVEHVGGYAEYHTRLDGSDPQNVSAGEWHHVAFTFNNTHGWAYYDGASRGDAVSAFSGQDFRDGNATIIGASKYGWEGQLDEVRVSAIANENVRSAAWIATEYISQRDASTFSRVGVEERRPTFDVAWRNFGFNLNATDTIVGVEIGVEWFRENTAPILKVTISWDGGATSAANQTASNKPADDDALQFLDFTPAVSWTPSLLNDANLRARGGTNASGAHVDHVVVRVTFTTASPPRPNTPPVVVTLEATNVTQETAIVRGSLLNLGNSTGVQVSLEWGHSPGVGKETAPETLQAPSLFQARLDELNPGTIYYYRAKAVGNGTALGETLTVQTAPAGSAPVVTTLEAMAVTRETAIFRGRLGDLGSATDVQVSFEWGLSPTLGMETAPVTLQTPATFQASLEALDSGTIYYYRAKAVGNGTALGETLTFQTAAQALPLESISQLWLYLPFVGVAVLIAYLITRKRLGAPRGNRSARSPSPVRGEVTRSPSGFFARMRILPNLWRGRGNVKSGSHESPVAASTTTKVTCPHCGTLQGSESVRCSGCGLGLTEITALPKRVERPEGTFGRHTREESVFSTAEAHHAAPGEGQKAIELLNRLEEAAIELPSEAPKDGGPDGPGSCLYCGTAVEPETGNCPECGRSVLDSYEALEENVTWVLATLELDENDPEALFTLGTCLLLDGKAQEALDTLNRLTLLDPDYPGLWRVKALVFEKLGNKGAAESALVQALSRSTGTVPEPE
ncbi:MAG: DUF2341 domain-containing protein [candidate division NC10 bacterium]